MSKSNIRTLVNGLWNARTQKDIDDCLTIASDENRGLEYRPLGDRANNTGTVEQTADPTLSSVERITNAIDSIIELEIARKNIIPTNPYDAARKLLGIPTRGIKEMSDQQRRESASRILVKLEDSGVKKKPTLIITDKGIGIEPKDFPRTILSLNKDNKAGKEYLMGTYGQGGSQLYGFSSGTLIMSRRQPDQRRGAEDVIGWTIVRKFFTESHKTAYYVYAVHPQSKEVFQFPAFLLPEMDFGTRIVHIEYDLHGIAGVYTQDPYYFYNSALFDPVIPFLLGGEKPYRATSDTTGTRVIYGNATRLDSTETSRSDIQLVYENEHSIELGTSSDGEKIGSVIVKYWVLAYPEGVHKSGGPAQSYASPDSAISVTLYGQRQGQESRYWISQQTKLGFIHKNLVVQVKAEGLTKPARDQFFSTDRQRVKNTDIKDKVFDELAQRLRDDKELRRLDRLEQERLLQKSIGVASEKIKTRLNEYIKQRLAQNQSLSTGNKGGDFQSGSQQKPVPKKYPTSVIDEPRKTTDHDLPHTPTYIKFEKKQITIEKGKQKPIWVEIDAKNGFLDDNPDALKIVWPKPKTGSIEIKSKSRLMGGKTQWYIMAEPDIENGQYEMSVSIHTAAKEITDKLVVTIVDPQINKEEKTNTGGSAPNVDPRWIRKSEWEEYEFNAKTVGKVTVTEEMTIILVNRDYFRLDKALSVSGLTERQINMKAERYLVPVAVALYMQDLDVKGLADSESRPSDEFLVRSNDYMAEAVLAAMHSDIEVAGEMERDV
jgi:hypothetical protein